MNFKLKMKILESKKSQLALAKEIGIPDSFFSKVVNGWITPTVGIQKKIAKALGCNISAIFSQETQEQQN